MDQTDKQLLNLLQTGFPLVSEPFAALADELGIDEDEIIRRVRDFKEQKIIRQISAIFDSAALGYKSSLVAFKVEKSRIEQVAEVVSSHPGVSHNYERSHDYNLWFTVTVPPGTTPEIEVEKLAELAKPLAVRLFPTLKVFKIGVAFDMTDGESPQVNLNHAQAPKREPLELSEDDIRAIRALQRDLPIEHSPFSSLARDAGMTADQLVEKARIFLQTGAMRRYAAVLRHREAGFSANAMVVWVVPAGKLEETGVKMAEHPAVSHCYQRPTYPDWPYSLFTMIHGRTSSDCEGAVREISESTGITDYALIYSTREFKKTRVKYYEHTDGEGKLEGMDP